LGGLVGGRLRICAPPLTTPSNASPSSLSPLPLEVILHSGDFAYDLSTTKGQRGNDFMNAIMPAAALVPYQGSVGNVSWKDKTIPPARPPC
jgi:hypothetical protein